jgi:hypothetical protein
MSKRHTSQQRRRGSGYEVRGPRYEVRVSRTTDRHDYHRGRTEKIYWYVVVDKESGQAASEEFSERSHADQLAEKMNGRRNRVTRVAHQLASARTLRQRVEAILDAANQIHGGAPRSKVPAQVTFHSEKDGSVLVRPVPFTPPSWAGPNFLSAIPGPDEQLEWQLKGCAAALTKAGLFAVDDRDSQGPFIRVTEL